MMIVGQCDFFSWNWESENVHRARLSIRSNEIDPSILDDCDAISNSNKEKKSRNVSSSQSKDGFQEHKCFKEKIFEDENASFILKEMQAISEELKMCEARKEALTRNLQDILQTQEIGYIEEYQ